MKIGDKVRCIDARDVDYLTLDKEYIVKELISECGSAFVNVINDISNVGTYRQERFEVVECNTLDIQNYEGEITLRAEGSSRIKLPSVDFSIPPDVVNVLGTDYTISYVDEQYDECLNNIYGYCDFLEKAIVLKKLSLDDFLGSKHTLEAQYKVTLRHEIIHAFLYESGLDSSTIDAWARNEEMVDWIALQLPKIVSVMSTLKLY